MAGSSGNTLSRVEEDGSLTLKDAWDKSRAEARWRASTHTNFFVGGDVDYVEGVMPAESVQSQLVVTTSTSCLQACECCPRRPWVGWGRSFDSVLPPPWGTSGVRYSLHEAFDFVNVPNSSHSDPCSLAITDISISREKLMSSGDEAIPSLNLWLVSVAHSDPSYVQRLLRRHKGQREIFNLESRGDYRRRWAAQPRRLSGLPGSQRKDSQKQRRRRPRAATMSWEQFLKMYTRGAFDQAPGAD
jgi:hypothetical protein